MSPQSIYKGRQCARPGWLTGCSTINSPVKSASTPANTATFFDQVENRGLFSVSDGSTALLLDDFTGTGILGDGHVVFESDVNLADQTHFTRFGADVEFTAAANWTVDISHGAHDGILSTGQVELGGALQLAADGPLALGTHHLTIVDAAALIGEFDFLPEIGTAVGERLIFQGIDYYSTTAVVALQQLPVGDFNGDGAVSGADYDAWRSAFGTSGNSLADGNGDSIVSAADYTIWRAAITGATASGTVPEPAALRLLALLIFWLPLPTQQLYRRRHD